MKELSSTSSKKKVTYETTRTNPDGSRPLTRDVVDLATAVVLEPVAAAAAAAAAAAGPAVAAPAGAALRTGHAHQTGGHRQLGGLGEVRQDPACRAGHPPLHLGLGLGRLDRDAQGVGSSLGISVCIIEPLIGIKAGQNIASVCPSDASAPPLETLKITLAHLPLKEVSFQ